MHRNKKKHVYIYSGTNILIMATKQELRQEPMTIIHEYEDYKRVYTIDTSIGKREALRAFFLALYTELLKVRDIPNRLLYLSAAWDMMNGDNPEEFNIIANRIKPGRNLSLKDFLYTPLHTDGRTHYIEVEDIDEDDKRMKILVGNFVFRVKPDTLVELFQNVYNLYVISVNGSFPYGAFVLREYNMYLVQQVFSSNFLLSIDPESDPFKFILKKIDKEPEMDFLDFVTITRTMNTKMNTKLRM